MQHLEQVRAIIADALYVDLAQVTPEANLMRDLGAESIDFLDISFRLERAFNITIPKGEIEQRARQGVSAAYAADGSLTEPVLDNLRSMMPEAAEAIAPGMKFRDIPSLFTVSTFARLVEEALATPEASAAGRPPLRRTAPELTTSPS